MPRMLAHLSLSLVVLAASVLPAAAGPVRGEVRRPAPTVVKKKPAPHWTSIAPDGGRLEAIPAAGRAVVPGPEAFGGGTAPFPAWGSGRTCDIVVKRPGGNPTQDMTGSIGHAKSHNSNGGSGRMRVCGGR